MKHIAVIDIGKTNAKVALVDLAAQAEVAVVTRPNTVLQSGPYPHFDTVGLWEFIADGLKGFAAQGVDGISITTHGACAALLAADGSLAAPVMDYEFTGPDDLRADYDRLRPDFSETGSPSLPHGLNLGAQLHWQLWTDPSLHERVSTIVTWPQYWGHMLTGAYATDLCSLGCHTDLWNPFEHQPSKLLATLGLQGILAPARRPSEVMGLLRPGLQSSLGLGPVPVLVGIHDSNASLYPYLLVETAPFAVVSTGTWVISMAIGGTAPALDAARDVLVNVGALGMPVPSARFMGGREYEVMMGNITPSATTADAESVLAKGLMLMPSVQHDSGPFQGRSFVWRGTPDETREREVAVGFYLALMTAECLGLIGAAGEVLVEGPLGKNQFYCAMLASATGRPVRCAASRTGTALGAALLFQSADSVPPPQSEAVLPDAPLASYAGLWRANL